MDKIERWIKIKLFGWHFWNMKKWKWLPPPVRGTLSSIPCFRSLRPGAMILGKPPLRLFWMSTIFMLFSCSRSCSLMCQATCSICSKASFKLVLSGCESGVFLITSSNNNLYLKRILQSGYVNEKMYFAPKNCFLSLFSWTAKCKMAFESNFWPIYYINYYIRQIAEKKPFSILQFRKKGAKSNFLERNTFFFVSVIRSWSKLAGTHCMYRQLSNGLLSRRAKASLPAASRRPFWETKETMQSKNWKKAGKPFFVFRYYSYFSYNQTWERHRW